MTYAEAINFLYNQLPMFSRIGAAAYKKDISNTIELCKNLNDPHKKFKSIHIAGTNGKGSVSHMIAAILQTAGYKTGLYTSPHLKDFRERIKINGKMCDENFVAEFTEQTKPAAEKIQPSFFEITVAMAFTWFEKNSVDIAVIETGLGGRLDSTNIILPELSVITNIGWDHMNILGDTLEKIAYEKAGIIKPHISVIIGETSPESKLVFEKVAAENSAKIIFADKERFVTDWQYSHHELNVTVAKKQFDLHHIFSLDLTGIYQLKNIITVLEAVHQLNKSGWEISEEAVAKGLHQTKKITGLHGRWELIHQNPSVILDVAHNADGIKQVVEQLELMSFSHLYIIIGMVKDKEVDNILKLLPKHAYYYFTKAQIPRALHEDELALKANNLGLKGQKYNDVNNAMNDALFHAQKEDLILVCGSVYLIGEVTL